MIKAIEFNHEEYVEMYLLIMS